MYIILGAASRDFGISRILLATATKFLQVIIGKSLARPFPDILIKICVQKISKTKKTHICLAPSRHLPRSAPFALACCAQMYAFYADTDESNNVINFISEVITSKLQTAHCAAAHRGKRSPLRSITSCRRSGKWRTRSCTWNCELMCCAHAVKLRES